MHWWTADRVSKIDGLYTAVKREGVVMSTATVSAKSSASKSPHKISKRQVKKLSKQLKEPLKDPQASIIANAQKSLNDPEADKAQLLNDIFDGSSLSGDAPPKAHQIPEQEAKKLFEEVLVVGSKTLGVDKELLTKALKVYGVSNDAQGVETLANYGAMGSLIDFLKEYFSTTTVMVPPVKIVIAVNQMREKCRVKHEMVTGETEVEVLSNLWEGGANADKEREALRVFDSPNSHADGVLDKVKPLEIKIPNEPKLPEPHKGMAAAMTLETLSLNKGSKETKITAEADKKVHLSTPVQPVVQASIKEEPITFDDIETIVKRVVSEQDSRVVAQVEGGTEIKEGAMNRLCPTPEQVMAEADRLASVKTGSAVRREKMPVLRQEGYGSTIVGTHTPLPVKNKLMGTHTEILKTSFTPRTSSFSERVKKAAEVLMISPEILTSELSRVGIIESDLGLKILDADITTEESLISLIKEKAAPRASLYQLKPAVAFLKGKNPFKSGSDPVVVKPVIPIPQMKDRELLEMVVNTPIPPFADGQTYAAVMELHARAKFQPVIILREDGSVNVDVSLEYLKISRKRTMPESVIDQEGHRSIQVYRITDLYFNDRVVEFCPVCRGGLYKGFCPICGVDFSEFNDEIRSQIMSLLEDSRVYKGVLLNVLKENRDLVSWLKIKDPGNRYKGKFPMIRTTMPRPASIPIN